MSIRLMKRPSSGDPSLAAAGPRRQARAARGARPGLAALLLAAAVYSPSATAAENDAPTSGQAASAEAEDAPEALPLIPVGQDDPAPSLAVDQAPAGRVLDQIVVTAQKREQALMDVPISMTALTGDFLAEQGVTDVTEALQLVPNASVDAAGFFAAPRIRGFTFNNNNKAFEPPVGLVIDGIPHTEVPYFLAALFDVQRLEVLRGPQGTSFGKNTTAGLIHLITRKPGTAFTGSLNLERGELGRNRVEAAFGGPLTENLLFRVSGLFDEREGFIRNTTAEILPDAPKRLKDRRRTGLRAQLLMPDLFGSRLELGYEAFELFDGGAALELLQAGPNFRDALRRYDPHADFIPGNFVTSQDLPDFRDISIHRSRLQWDTSLGDWGLVAIGGQALMKERLSLDTDFTPAEAINGFGGDRAPLSYGELRAVAPTLDGLLGLRLLPGSTDLLFGVNASRRELRDSDFTFGINSGPFLDLLDAAGRDAQGAGTGGTPGPLPANPADTDSAYEEFNQRFDQISEDLSFFAHLQWQFLPHWSMELGGRLTTETKRGVWDVEFTTPPPNPILVGIGVEEFEAVRERRERNFQPKVSLNWQPSDTFSAFLHWEKGFKGGGFNAFAFREGDEGPPPSGTEGAVGDFSDDDLVFEEETGTNWGLDFKTRLLGGAATANLSLFRQTATDFQVLIRENPAGTIGLGTSRVVNAEKARAQGVEMDLTWLATDWLTVVGSSGYLDTRYLDFPDNECPAGRGDTDDDDDNPRCDATGKPFPFAPRWSNTLGLRVTLPAQQLPLLGALFSRGGYEWVFGALAEHESSQLLDLDLEETKRQGAYLRYRADFGLRDLDRRWSLRVVGENLTNTVTHVRLGDIFNGVVHGSQRQPRLFYLQFRQDF
jgi:outer membrane receptor protein involved in Fe transport